MRSGSADEVLDRPSCHLRPSDDLVKALHQLALADRRQVAQSHAGSRQASYRFA